MPPVGSYDIINYKSIHPISMKPSNLNNFTVRKNSKELKMIAFQSLVKRFNLPISNFDLYSNPGPGKYSVCSKSEKNIVIGNASREEIISNQFFPGPDRYDILNNYSLNKRSFNIRYAD